MNKLLLLCQENAQLSLSSLKEKEKFSLVATNYISFKESKRNLFFFLHYYLSENKIRNNVNSFGFFFFPSNFTRSYSVRSYCRLSAIKNRKQNRENIDNRHSLFNELDIHPVIQNALKLKGIKYPTNMQISAIKNIDSGKDVTINAETGVGKTLAYLLPIINRIYKTHDFLYHSIIEISKNKIELQKKTNEIKVSIPKETIEKKYENQERKECNDSIYTSVNALLKEENTRNLQKKKKRTEEKILEETEIKKKEIEIKKINELWGMYSNNLRHAYLTKYDRMNYNTKNGHYISRKELIDLFNKSYSNTHLSITSQNNSEANNKHDYLNHNNNQSNVITKVNSTNSTNTLKINESENLAKIFSTGENIKNPLRSLRPWVILLPNRDLVAQTFNFIDLLDPLGRVVIQTLTDFTDFPSDNKSLLESFMPSPISKSLNKNYFTRQDKYKKLKRLDNNNGNEKNFINRKTKHLKKKGYKVLSSEVLVKEKAKENHRNDKNEINMQKNFYHQNVKNYKFLNKKKNNQIFTAQIISHNFNSRVYTQKFQLNHTALFHKKKKKSSCSFVDKSNSLASISSLSPYSIPAFGNLYSSLKFMKTPIISAARIRWGSVDIVLTTPELFLKDIERFAAEKLYPSCLIFDEVDMLFHNNSSRKHILDIIHYIRPRLPIPVPFTPKTHIDMAPCQVICVGATIPSLGITTAGVMVTERFCTAIDVCTASYHKVPLHIKQQWIYLNEEKIECTYMRKKDNSNELERSSINSKIESKDKSLNDSKKELDFSFFCNKTRKKERINYRQASFEHRLDVLIQVLKNQICRKTIVFVNTAYECKQLYTFLAKHGWPVYSYHKGMDMCSRMNALKKFFFHGIKKSLEENINNNDLSEDEFKDEDNLHVFPELEEHEQEDHEQDPAPISILIATDLASRGIDMHRVDHIINFHFPTDAVTYIHRCGRTGRLTENGELKNGLITNFVAQDDMKLVRELRQCQFEDKRLHSTFSRRRSFNTRLKRRKENENEGNKKKEFDEIENSTRSHTKNNDFSTKMNDNHKFDTRNNGDLPDTQAQELQELWNIQSDFYAFQMKSNSKSEDEKTTISDNLTCSSTSSFKLDDTCLKEDFPTVFFQAPTNFYGKEENLNVSNSNSYLKNARASFLQDSDSDNENFEKFQCLKKDGREAKNNLQEKCNNTSNRLNTTFNWNDLNRGNRHRLAGQENSEKNLIQRFKDRENFNVKKKIVKLLVDNFNSEDPLFEDDVKL